MFALIESCPDQRPGFGWTGRAVSLAIHAFVISAALAFTEHVAAGPSYRPEVRPVIWYPPAPPTRAPVTDQNSLPQVVLPGPLPPMAAPTVIPTDIPPPGPTPGVEPVNCELCSPVAMPVADPAGHPVIGDAPRDVRVVDELPILLSHPAIAYPEALRQAGVEGRVVIETVLDTLGQAERTLTRVTTSGTELFDREATRVVLASRYRPARVNGRAVRVRIAVPVNFTIRP